MALASIAKVDDFYASALPSDGNKITKKTAPLIIKVHKRDWEVMEEDRDEAGDKAMKEAMRNSGAMRKVGRFVFKFFRILYASFIFYFLPYTSLFLPYLALPAYVA